MRPILLNTSLHALVFLLLVSLISIFRASSNPRKVAPPLLIRCLQSRILLVFVMAGTVVNIGLRVTAGYINPRDYLQDYVAAQRVLERESIYPSDLPVLAADLADNQFPGRQTLESVPILRGEFTMIRENAPGNAHPPLNAVLVALPAAILGARGSFLFFWVFFSACLVILVRVILAEYLKSLPTPYLVGILAFLFGWYPVIATLRNAYSSILIALLCVGCWYFLRRGRQAWAGACIGLATCLHFYPIFIAGYLFFRKRVAFLSFLASSVIAVGLSTLLTYPSVYQDWIQTAKEISAMFVSLRRNYSMTGNITFLLKTLEVTFNHQVITVLVGCCIFGFLIYALRLWREPDAHLVRGDLEFSAFLVGSLLVSPITWQNYFTVVLLPIAVLLACEQHHLTPRKTFTLLAIGVILSVPSLPIEEVILPVLQRSLGIFPAWLLTSAPTLALVVLMGWLAMLGRSQKFAGASMAGCEESQAKTGH